MGSVEPVCGETQERARAAARWILRAHEAAGNGGVPHGYFPLDVPSGWRLPYPEVTGYIIPTLLEYARRNSEPDVRTRALQMADWEIGIQMECGAVQAGVLDAGREQAPAVFNTGMVLDGWSSAYRETGNQAYLTAAGKAAEFILRDIGADGHLRTHGPLVEPNPVKTYNCLCAWSLYRHGEDSADSRFTAAAVQIVDAAIRQQSETGWFANNCLTDPHAPLLHTIGYALQGIVEVGIMADRKDFLEAARRGVDPLVQRLSPQGFLYGQYLENWEPACFYSCLTGSAQVAVVCYRLFQHTGVSRYRQAGDRIINFLKALQELDHPDSGITGALAGSFPILGAYMPGGYPCWATKYFLDALMLQGSCETEGLRAESKG